MEKQKVYEPKFFMPNEAGLGSWPRAAGRRVAKLLHALEDLNMFVCHGQILNDLRDLKIHIIDSLQTEGWRVYRNQTDKWQVLPPREKK